MSAVFRYPTNPAGKIKSIRVIYDNGDWWEHSATAEVPSKVRLHVARALVADMPGVVVAKVPEELSEAEPVSMSLDDARTWRIAAKNYNAAITAIITAGSATDV